MSTEQAGLTAFVNGAFVALESAAMPALDAGLQHGVGLFETMLGGRRRDAAGTPWVMDLDDHLDRLARSAKELGLSDGLRTGALAEVVLETVAQSGLKPGQRARVRLTVTGGALNLLRRPAGGEAGRHEPGVLCTATAATAYPAPLLEKGGRVVVADTKANPFNAHEGHKTLNYWWRLRELQAAAGKGADEALVLSVTNHLVGGCVSNALLVKGGEVFTPIARGEEQQAARTGAAAQSAAEMLSSEGAPEPVQRGATPAVLPSASLPGITRLWAIRRLAGEGVVVRKRMVSIGDILTADELMLTNSSWGVLPIIGVEGTPIARAEPGEMARMLTEAWAEDTASEAGE
ncbi:MAG: aminotransferase class IV [Planctomycetaceae bacterium]|jgi:branched-subunit amino acid aminotransferase/4-amino-4-deoxychorismate lyase|nr:aminotransferase class IV [Phycisphaerales bacterium]MCE2654480.1 aminotransferase class IV [Planctomycetaceae bacterium]